jgi:hypothetical protein
MVSRNRATIAEINSEKQALLVGLAMIASLPVRLSYNWC